MFVLMSSVSGMAAVLAATPHSTEQSLAAIAELGESKLVFLRI